MGGADPVQGLPALDSTPEQGLAEIVTERKLVPRPADGLVREINENTTLSREVKRRVEETEETAYLGEFSDEVRLI